MSFDGTVVQNAIYTGAAAWPITLGKSCAACTTVSAVLGSNQ